MAIDCRNWLRANSYVNVAELIDCAMTKMAEWGSKQRRNWWDILAVAPNGKLASAKVFSFQHYTWLRCGKENPSLANRLGFAVQDAAMVTYDRILDIRFGTRPHKENGGVLQKAGVSRF